MNRSQNRKIVGKTVRSSGNGGKVIGLGVTGQQGGYDSRIPFFGTGQEITDFDKEHEILEP